MAEPRRASRLAKRALDIVLSMCALIALSPVLVLVALAIRLTMGAPIIFRQVRPGLHARPFTIYKFRTMAHPRAPGGELADQNLRVTKLGSLLRRTSFDEIPELFNVIRGDMSIVGPRPLLMEYLPHYSPQQRRRHEVRPGVTGLAQTRGRHEVGWDDRFKLDVWYVDHWSLRLDAHIMLDTIRVLTQGQEVPDQNREDFWFGEIDKEAS